MQGDVELGTVRGAARTEVSNGTAQRRTEVEVKIILADGPGFVGGKKLDLVATRIEAERIGATAVTQCPGDAGGSGSPDHPIGQSHLGAVVLAIAVAIAGNASFQVVVLGATPQLLGAVKMAVGNGVDPVFGEGEGIGPDNIIRGGVAGDLKFGGAAVECKIGLVGKSRRTVVPIAIG